MPVVVHVRPDSDPVIPLDGVATYVQFAESSFDATKTDMVVTALVRTGLLPSAADGTAALLLVSTPKPDAAV
jgi:hypothetical protein